MPSIRKVMSRVKNRKKKATVDLNVHSSRTKVKMNHPCSNVRSKTPAVQSR